MHTHERSTGTDSRLYTLNPCFTIDRRLRMPPYPSDNDLPDDTRHDFKVRLDISVARCHHTCQRLTTMTSGALITCYKSSCLSSLCSIQKYYHNIHPATGYKHNMIADLTLNTSTPTKEYLASITIEILKRDPDAKQGELKDNEITFASQSTDLDPLTELFRSWLVTDPPMIQAYALRIS